ncbi:MAG: histidinol-phosphatase [Tenericutes bacterium HGW-Tenericutes-1]|jgi:histidinol-phosphatase (PHP family)|nr:MAG: histidinol-phosphatase [Tenericutes bacterium HGW-Tenericutes-1]
MKANYHTHTKLCGHAVGMSEDYIKEAIKNNFETIGISDHGPIPREYMSDIDYKNNYLEYQMDNKVFDEIYLPDIEKSIRKYSNKIKIFKGIEIEYLTGHDDYYRKLLSKLDYMSLGVHFFEMPNGIYNTYDLMNKETVYYYGEQVVKALETGFFAILNHPDLYMMSYKNQQDEPEFDYHCEQVAVRIIEAAIKNNVYLEINGGGPRREKIRVGSTMQYVYPRDEFWRVVERYKEAKVIIGIDSHNPKEFYDNVIKDVELYSKKFNFKVLNDSDSIINKG